MHVKKGYYGIVRRHNPRNAASSTLREPMTFVFHKMYVMDHMKQGGDLHMFIVVLMFFPSHADFLVLFQHVFAPRHKTDFVRR